MEQYISKSAVVAEIERRKHKLLDHIICERDKEWVVRTAHQLNRIIMFIDTLEMKEVDLEKEIQRQYDVHKNTDNSIVKDCVIMTKDGFEYFAKHFFELGLCSTITKEDCKLIWNIGDDLPYMPEEDFFGELLRRYKAQKGE